MVSITRITPTNIFLWTSTVVFAIISKIIFDRVFLTSNLVIDEEFHLELGKAYCNFEFSQWHPKVTTFPGLYLISSVILGPFKLCSTYALRMTSLIFGTINIVLFYHLLKISNSEPSWKNIVSALNLAILPPLYFFTHLYYTDVTSLTMVLLLFITSFKGRHFLAAIFGMLAILCRQTNIVWTGMTFGMYVIKELVAAQNKKHSEITIQHLIGLFQWSPRKNILATLRKMSLDFWLNSSCYLCLPISFLVFVYLNGSIVVGDKSAHEVTINLPQIFYFSLFCLLFSLPHFLSCLKEVFPYVMSRKLFVSIVLMLSLLVVHFNTVTHPYLLADNRHYVFYIWNRFYGRYDSFKYLMTPVYLFSLYVIFNYLYNRKDIRFVLFYIPCTIVVLVPQLLFEFRYFLIPYVLLRCRVKNATSLALIIEFLSHLIVNAGTLYLFFNKTIEWSDFDYPQRLMW